MHNLRNSTLSILSLLTCCALNAAPLATTLIITNKKLIHLNHNTETILKAAHNTTVGKEAHRHPGIKKKTAPLDKSKLLTSSKKNNTISNAFNFKSLYGSSISTRTGMVGFHFTLGHLIANKSFGPNISLILEYNQNVSGDLYNLGAGWSFNLSHYNSQTQTISLASGGSFHISNIGSAGLKTLQYQKLDMLKVYEGGAKDKYFLKVVYKDGHIEYLDAAGYLTMIQSARGDVVTLTYNTSTGGHILTSMQDQSGDKITLQRGGGGYSVTSKDSAGNPTTSKLWLSDNLLTKITLPVVNQAITFSYRKYGNKNLISEVAYPTGSWDSFEYTMLKGASIQGHTAFTTYAVSQYISHPYQEASSSDIKVTYQYNVVPGHNYLASNANVPYSSTKDLLFSAQQDYEYGTKVFNGKSTTTYLYNKFHLLMDQSIVNNQGDILKNAEQCYATNTLGGQVCGTQAVNTTIDALPAFYSLPVQTIASYYTLNAGSRAAGQTNSSSRRMVTTSKSYDNQGNALSSTGPSGMKSISAYGAANANGFVNAKESTTILPADAGQAGAPASKRTTYQYLKLKPLYAGPVADLSLPKTQTISYEAKNGTWQDLRQKTNQYYTQTPKGLLKSAWSQSAYGLLKSTLISDMAPQHYGATQLLQSTAQNYHYKLLTTITINGKIYQAIQSNVQQAPNNKGLSDRLGADSTRTITQYVSPYTNKTLMQVDPNGNKIAFLYDALGRKVESIANVGTDIEAIKHYQYTIGSNNNTTIITAPNGYQTKVSYDGLGRVTTKYVEHIGSDGKAVSGQWDEISSIKYNRYGQKASTTSYDTDGHGKLISLTTYYEYDAQNRPTVTSYPNGSASVVVYDDANNRTITYALSSNGQVVEGPSPCRIGDVYYGATIRNFMVTDKNNAGKKIASYLIASNPNGKSATGMALYNVSLQSALVKHESFLASGLVLNPAWLPSWIQQVVNAKAYYSMSSSAYDGLGRLMTATGVDGYVTHYSYDHMGHLAKTTLPNGNTATTLYDMMGNKIQVGVMINRKDQVLATRYYNQLGDLLWEKDPLGNQHSYQYDANGNVIQITTPNDQIVDQQYNGMNKLIRRSVAGDEAGLYTTTWQYDTTTGKISQRHDATGTTTYTYYPNRQLRQASHTTAGSQLTLAQPAYTLSYTYTLLGKPKTVTDASGKVTNYTYNPDGRLSTVSFNGQSTRYAYDQYSRLSTVTYPNHMQTQYRYDDYNSLSSLIHEQLAPTKSIITQFTYTYDKNGNIHTRTRVDASKGQSLETYTYDGDNNLSSYQCQGGLCPKDQKGNTITRQMYSFDAVNNISKIASTLLTPEGKILSNTTSYDYSSLIPTRLINYENSESSYGSSPVLVYDKDGNMTQDSQYRMIKYDPMDRTQSVTHKGNSSPSVSYIYNGANVQVGEIPSAKNATYFIYGHGGLLNTEKNKHFTRYIYGSKRIAKQSDAALTYYLTDQGSSVIDMVGSDPKGLPQLIASYAYSPYGIESLISKAKKEAPIKLFGFDDQLTDAQTGWQFLGKGYRAYNPLLHRFMSQDTMSPFDKGGINGYIFASNNPIMSFDPSGHSALSLGMNIGGIVAGVIGAIAAPFTGGSSLLIGLAIGSGVMAAGSGAAGIVGNYSHNKTFQAISQYLGYVAMATGVLSVRFSLAAANEFSGPVTQTLQSQVASFYIQDDSTMTLGGILHLKVGKDLNDYERGLAEALLKTTTGNGFRTSMLALIDTDSTRLGSTYQAAKTGVAYYFSATTDWLPPRGEIDWDQILSAVDKGSYRKYAIYLRAMIDAIWC